MSKSKRQGRCILPWRLLILKDSKQSAQILLVNLPFPYSEYNTCFEKKDYEEHLGLESLASALREKEFSVKIIDAHSNDWSMEDIIKEIVHNEYKLIGFSLFQFSVNVLKDICKKIKYLKENIHITAGGHFVTGSYEQILDNFLELDSIIRGEGEYTLCELAEKIINELEWTQVPGLAYHKNGKACLSPNREMIIELDKLPYPARDFLDDKVDEGKKVDTINIYSSRGCYGTCKFCSIKAFYDKKGPAWRARSAKNVVDELDYLNNKYKPNRFMFVDDNFIGIGKRGKLRVIEIALEIIKRKLNISFMISCRVNDVEPALFHLLKKAGLVEVFLGIESFSNSELKFFNKQISCDESFKTIEFLQKMNINISAGFIMFTPYTRLEDVKRNIKYLEKYKMMDEGKFTFINRVVGSSFDMDRTPGMLDTDYNIFDYPFNGKMGYNIFNDKTSRLANIIRNQNLTLKGFSTLRKCRELIDMANSLPDYSLYDIFLTRITNNNVKVNVNYVQNIIYALNGEEFANVEYMLNKYKVCWDNDIKLVDEILSEIKSCIYEKKIVLWRFFLNPDVMVINLDNGRFKYINTVSNSYLIVEDRIHKICHTICNCGYMTYINILEYLHISEDEFIGLVNCFFNRSIIDFENSNTEKWEKISDRFNSDKEKVAFWDIQNEVINNSYIHEITELLVKREVMKLKIFAESVNDLVLQNICGLNHFMKNIVMQTSIHNYSELKPYICNFDQFIFVITNDDLLHNSKMIIELQKDLYSIMPEPPVFIVDKITSELLDTMSNIDIAFEIKIALYETKEEHVLNQYKIISRLSESNPNISTFYNKFDNAGYSSASRIRQKEYLDSKESIYI